MNNDERNALIERLFAEASQLPSAEHAAFLDKACAGDDELQHEVESLLTYDLTRDRLLETSAAAKLARALIERDEALTGQEFDGYYLVRELGRGGMGRVYLAEDLRLKRRLVAVKVLPELFAQNTAWVERFKREAQAASALNHPNIVTIHATGQRNGLPFIVMEYIEGVTLRERLQQGALAWPEAVRIATQIAGALHTAHLAGIVHRDIKPENVMLRAGRLVKVLDFGIARWKDEGGEMKDEVAEQAPVHPSSFIPHPSLTVPGAVIGTTDYLSPEQARGEPVDARTDIFSFGLLLAEMLTGRHPLADLRVEEKLAVLTSAEEFAVLVGLATPIPAALGQLVARAVRKRRADRPASAGELGEVLNELHPAREQRPANKAQSFLRTQSANRLLNQFIALYEADARTPLAPLALWTIWRHADIKRGRLEAALLRRSLASACWKTARVAMLAGFLTLGCAAWFSIEEKWEVQFMRDGHSLPAKQLALAPDEQTLVSVGDDSQVILWDMARRVRQATLTEHTRAVTAVTFTPDGNWFATAGADGRTIVWDAASLTKAAVLPGRYQDVDEIRFTPNGRYLAAPADQLMLWEVGTWRNVGRVLAGSASLLSPDSRLSVTGMWLSVDLVTSREFTSCSAPTWNYAALSPDATQLATVDPGGFVGFWDMSRFWDAGEHRLIQRVAAHRDHGRAVAYSPDGRLVATGSEEIIVWEAATWTKLARFTYKDIVTSLVFTGDSRQLLSAYGSGAILVWDLAEKVLAADFAQHCGPVHAVSFSPDRQAIASASDDHSIIIWDAASGLKRAVMLGHQAPVIAVAFARTGQVLASSDMYGNAILWDAQTQTPLRHFASLRQKDTALGYCAALSPDGRWLVTTFGVYDTRDGRAVVRFLAPEDESDSEIHGVAFSPDGRWLACVATGHYIYLWEVGRWRLQQSTVAQDNVIAVSFAPDGRSLVTGTDKGAIQLWQVEPLRELGVLGQHQSDVESIAFSPDGREVVSASDDETIALWDVAQRRFIANVGRHNPSVLAVAFSPDGRHLASGEQDKSVHVYKRQRSLWGWRLD
jgi:WD40 repeat protein/serine/threonine protein kinase